MTDISPEQVEQAKVDYQRALEILHADRLARDLVAKQAAVGKCYKYVDHARTDPSLTWPIYLTILNVDPHTGQLLGWNFQELPSGQIAVTPEADVQPGFLAEHCHEIARSVFIAAFNEMLTAIARYGNKIPNL